MMDVSAGGLKGKVVFASALSIVLLLCACSRYPEKSESETENGLKGEEIYPLTAIDQNTVPEQAEILDLSGRDGTVILSESGDYLLKGKMDGQIIIDVYEDERIHLYLDGADIASAAGPAIYVKSASKLIVTLMPDSENRLSDTVEYEGYEDSEACLYSVSDLTINGEGSLFVYGYHKDGVRSKDKIKIAGGNLEIQAKGDGIRGNDGFAMKEGVLHIQSEANGIRTANSGKAGKGDIELSGGEINLVAGKNGISGAGDVHIRDCVCEIYSIEENIRTSAEKYIDEGCLP